MAKEKLIKPNSNDQEVLDKIQRLTGEELKQFDEIEYDTCGYTIDKNGYIGGMGLFNSITETKLDETVKLLEQLVNLTTLNLNANNLTDLSPLQSLVGLTTLDLRGNNLIDISSLQFLVGLTELILSDNNLTDISSLQSLVGLRTLYLALNNLTDISSLQSLVGLTTLVLYDNHLTDVSWLQSLLGLTKLYLSGNNLTDISSLQSLVGLTALDLRNNKLTGIGHEFFERDWAINWGGERGGLNLGGNPLETPPVEIVKKGREAILSYFASLEGERKKLNEAKVLIVGTGGSGKTSLLKRIFGEPFDGKESQTKGIVIREKSYRKDGQSLKAHFWDFGGQVIMHSSHQFFLSQRSLYILVLDGRKEGDIEHWLQLIESFGGDSPILVVLNKMDENPGFEVNRRFLQEKYKRILGFYRISCKDDKGNGIKGKDGLINGIRNAFDEVEMMGTEWGESWFDVKKELEKLKTGKKHFIDSMAYEKVCIDAGITNPKDQETLVDYLNDLGVILHFKDLDLIDMHVLDPHWVTDAVYRIINSKKLADNHGELRADDLKAILKKRKTEDFSYPLGKHHFILNLMGKFELCYPLGDDGDVLVPDLQDVQEPEIPSFGDSPLQFYFKYSYLPSSVLPRFTVRSHDEIVGDLRWRTGLVIQNSNFNATAVIKSDADRKRICIEVYGDQKREYFSCVRREFFRIHEGYNKLGITQWIPLPDEKNGAVSYSDLYGHWKAGKQEFFSGDHLKSYSVSSLLNMIESPEDRESNEISKVEQLLVEIPSIKEDVIEGQIVDENNLVKIEMSDESEVEIKNEVYIREVIKIPEDLRFGFKQYLVYFNEYLDKAKGLNIGLEIHSDEEGLELLVRSEHADKLSMINEYLSEYTDFIAKGINNITIVSDENTDEKHAAMLIVELRNQIRHLESNLEIKQVENHFLTDNVKFLTYQFDELHQTLRVKCKNPKPVNLTLVQNAHQDQHNRQTTDIVANINTELPKLQEEFDGLKDILADVLPEKMVSKMKSAGEALDSVTPQSSDEKKNSALNKVARFLKQFGDEESETNKVIKGMKSGAGYIKKGIKLYNKIAPFVGLIPIPGI